MKIVFMGSPPTAVPSVQALIESGEEVVAVVSQPDRPAGRGRQMTACAVAHFARDRRLPLLQPEKAREGEFVQKLRGLKPDLIVVVAYGQILPTQVLEIPPLQCINVHFSLLPRYRGAAPIQWALINGEELTGVSTLTMTEKLDAGPILRQKKVPIEPDDTVETLGIRLANVGAEMLVETLEAIRSNDLYPLPQREEEATQAPSLKKEDGLLDFGQKAMSLFHRVRGVTPWPGAFIRWKGQLLKIHAVQVLPHQKRLTPGVVVAVGPVGIEVACAEDSLLLQEVQLEGKKRMPASEFLKGHPLKTGDKLE